MSPVRSRGLSAFMQCANNVHTINTCMRRRKTKGINKGEIEI